MHEIRDVPARHSWTKDGETVASLDVRLPHIDGVPKRVNNYYSILEKRLRSFCRRRARAGERGIYRLDYTVGLSGGEYISIYCDVYRDGVVRARTACTWDAASGYPLPLGHFTELSRRAVTGRISALIERERFPVYFKSYGKRLRRFYDPDNFWLSEEGIHFYYQPLTLAPAEYGVSHFLL
ncbi:MAG: RsiV family protein [Oscillospiraceae bacterium]|nr:RsiV family protein [Oscillospiraceae bacterium]